MLRKNIYFAFILLFLVKNAMAFELTSPAVQQGELMPKQYTCDGADVSPPLAWKDVPAGTRSFVLILEDPDASAGTWTHWVIYNIPGNLTALPENLQQLPEGAIFAKNSWNTVNYKGPCPPDNEHRYFFKLYALNTSLPSSSNLTKQEIENAMKGNIIGTTELMTRYHQAGSTK